jgi:hypothetical protein
MDVRECMCNIEKKTKIFHCCLIEKISGPNEFEIDPTKNVLRLEKLHEIYAFLL